MDKPKVVVMCGSSRFVEEMAVCEWIIERDELAVTMGLNLLPWWYGAPDDHLAEAEGCADQMDELHLRKIDLADEIFVVDACLDGEDTPYVGPSTSNEIRYAESKGVDIRRFSESPLIHREVYERMLAGINRQKHLPDQARGPLSALRPARRRNRARRSPGAPGRSADRRQRR